MFCWKCGKEIEEDSLFCPYCGSRMPDRGQSGQEPPQSEKLESEQPRSGQPQPEPPQSGQPQSEPPQSEQPQSEPPRSEQPQPVPSTSGNNSKKGVGLAAVIGIVVFILIGRFVGVRIGKKMAESYNSNNASKDAAASISDAGETGKEKEQEEAAAEQEEATSEQEENTAKEGMTDDEVTDEGGADLNPEDDLLHYSTVQMEVEDVATAFITVFYGMESHFVRDITVEYAYKKSQGYTVDRLKATDFSGSFPEFAEFSYDEDDKYVFLVCKMKNVDSKERILALEEANIISLKENSETSAGTLDSEKLRQSYLDTGWSPVSSEFYDRLDYTLIFPEDSVENAVNGESGGIHYCVLRSQVNNQFVDYEILYYTEGEHKLTGLTTAVLYPKSFEMDGEQYYNTRETLESSNFEQHYPDFTESSLSENEDYFIYTFKMRDFQQSDRIQQMIEKRHIYLSTENGLPEWIDAEEFSVILQDYLYEAVDPSECDFLDLTY